MLAAWVSLKENVNCVCRLTDVVGKPEKACRNSRNQNLEKQLVHQLRNPFREALFRPIYPNTQIYELHIGDPSRNIIELIFHRASMDPSKPSWKVKKVLKVKNSIEVLKRFDMEFTRKNGVRLSTCSEEVSDNMVSFKLKNLRRAVIVCRVIAGSIANTTGGAYGDFDSIGREGPRSNLEYLIVQNPSAILPLKVNVDGAFDPRTRLATIGVIAWDSNGRVLSGMVSTSPGCVEARFAETHAIIAIFI
ncbi:hypothetical protein F3Y22_tig00110809pilonHSYRG00255 [Hibiscus syriacus]|uniref:Uncharacterized protein n=1 Tax=Hibiscus syriacus TaxID=106335 RepID=A0A6A2ZP69_HIBSY|nr:hypothetical protein F3Y22_tig00110809pilonHSYRG00255 [Hibiscus syriacus]